MATHVGTTSNTLGIWIIGAYGDIASTLMAGTIAIRRGLSSHTGLVSEMAPFNQLGLRGLDELVFAGQDIVESSVTASVREVSNRSKTFAPALVDAITADLAEIDPRIALTPKLRWNSTLPTHDALSLTRIVADQRALIAAFKQDNALAHVVVINIASAEPMPPDDAAHETLEAFEQALALDRKDVLAPSSVYAYAAFREGCSHINFTPCTGANLPALCELAKQLNLPHCGNDGKTGETLIKTALAPMFAMRHLHVMSWEGFNILGNGDGLTLSNPVNREGKIRNKAGVLDSILGYSPHAGVTINYVPSLGDWKTAWDFIHFRGFLDVPMTMQFTWHGCDSILAAPLILDMARFCEFSARHGEGGALSHLACFFKNPIGVEEMALYRQHAMLVEYAAKHIARRISAESA